MIHYVPHRYQVDGYGRRRAMGAVCGDREACAATLTLSDVSSLIDCPACREEIRRSEKDPHQLALIEHAWKGPDAEKPVWDERQKRWSLPSLMRGVR